MSDGEARGTCSCFCPRGDWLSARPRPEARVGRGELRGLWQPEEADWEPHSRQMRRAGPGLAVRLGCVPEAGTQNLLERSKALPVCPVLLRGCCRPLRPPPTITPATHLGSLGWAWHCHGSQRLWGPEMQQGELPGPRCSLDARAEPAGPSGSKGGFLSLLITVPCDALCWFDLSMKSRQSFPLPCWACPMGPSRPEPPHSPSGHGLWFSPERAKWV